jgi:hypothetical protein
MSKSLFVSVSLAIASCLPEAAEPPAAPTAPPPGSDAAEPRLAQEPPPVGEPAAQPAVGPPVEPGVTRTNAPTRGSLPKAVIAQKLESAGPAIRVCYERALVGTPNLGGNLSVNFVVAPDGTVAHAEAVEVDQPLNDPEAVGCILDVIRELEFPEPTGGRVFLNYPLSFQPPKPVP